MAQSSFHRKLSVLANSNRIMFAVMMIAVITMMVDVSLARVYNLIPKFPMSFLKIVAFCIMAAIVITCQYFILGYIGHKSSGKRTDVPMHVRALDLIVKLSQLVIGALLIFLVLQIVFLPYYDTIVLIALVAVSYGLAICMMGYLTQRFFSWSILNKKSLMILYAVATASLSVNAGFTLAYANDILLDRPAQTGQFSAGSMVTILPNSVTAALNSGFFVSTIVSFSLLWGATVMLLHHRATKLGRIRYWLIMSSPLALFLSQFIGVYIHLFDPLFGPSPVSVAFWTTLIFTISKPVGGILFGLAFFVISRSLREDVALRRFLVISACGFVLFFSANQASVLLVAPFPPFGIISVSLVGLASSLIFSGIYSVAIFVSEDAKLRQSIRRASLDQSGLLDNVGTAQLKEQIQKKVIKIMKDNSEQMKERTEAESMPSEKDVEEYVEEVIKEIISRRSSSSYGKKLGDEAGRDSSS